MSDMNDPEVVENLAKALNKLNEEKERKVKLDQQSYDVNMKNKSAQETYEEILEKADAKGREYRLKLDSFKLDEDNLRAQNALYELKKDNEKLSAKIEADEEKVAQLRSDGLNDQADALEENIAKLNKVLDLRVREVELQEESGLAADKLDEKNERAMKSGEKLFESLAQKSGLFSVASSGMVSSIMDFAKEVKNAENPTEVLANSFGQFFNMSRFALGTLQKFVESTVFMVGALDKANTQFAASTGFGNKFSSTLYQMRREGNAAGVDFQNAGNALKALTQNTVGFVNMSRQAQVDVAKTAAQFERIGINADTSAEFVNIFSLNMGKTKAQSMELTKQLAMMGTSAGISAGKMTKDFQAAFKSLAVYGEKSIEVFQGLASAARAAGVEVSSLTALAGKFDTFAGSAETVGKLNALLGSQLSSTEMLMMTEDKRVETLVQQVQAQGVNFKDMNKFQQMAIANAAGISDMNEAQRIFGMNMKDYKKYRKDMERQESVQKRFNEAVEATIPIQEKMKIIMHELVIAVEPLLSLLEGVADMFISLLKFMGPTGTSILAAAVAFGTLYHFLFRGSKVLRGLQALMAIFRGTTIASTAATAADTIAQGANSVAKNVNADATKAQGRASAVGGNMAGLGALGMLKFALAVLMIGAGVGMAAAGIGYMVSSFVELAAVGPEAVASLTAFSLALGALMMSGGMGLFGAGGLMLGMMVIKDGLQEIGKVLEDNRALQEGLENLALVSTGRGAAAMKAGGATLAGDLKAAVSAAMTQKLEVVIKLKDSALKDMVENVVVNSITSDGRVAAAVAKIS